MACLCLIVLILDKKPWRNERLKRGPRNRYLPHRWAEPGQVGLNEAQAFAYEPPNSAAQEMHQLPCKWEANEIQTKVEEGSERGEHRSVFVHATLAYSVIHAAAGARAKRPVKFYHNSNSSLLGQDKLWHQDGEDNSSLCGCRAEAWPGWTEGLVSGPAVLSSCLNLCLCLCHTCNFNSAWKLT